MTERDISQLIASRIHCLRDRNTDPNRPLLSVMPLVSLGWAVVEPVIAYRSDPDPVVRENVARILSHSIDPRVFGPLMEALHDPEPPVRFFAAGGLGRYGHPDAVEPLIKLLQDSDRQVSLSAAGALGALGDERALLPLADMLHSATTDYSRWRLIEAIAKIPGRNATDVLLAHTRNENSFVRKHVASALRGRQCREVTQAFLEMIGDRDSMVRSSAGFALGDCDLQSLIPDLLSLMKPGNSAFAKGNAARLLRHTGDPALAEPISELLCDESPSVRIGAAVAIGCLTGTTPVEAIADLIHDEDELVRLSAARLLANASDQRGADTLAELVNSEKAAVSKDVVAALVRLGDPRAFGLVDSLLASREPQDRRRALSLLPSVEDADVVTRLVGLLKDEDWLVRRNAMRHLAETGDSDAADRIAPLMNDENEHVRRSAMSRLAEIGDKRALKPLLDELPLGGDSRFSVLMALRKLVDPAAIPALVALMQTGEPDIQSFSTRVLAAIDHPDAVQALRGALVDNDSAWVRAECARALVDKGGTEAREALVGIVERQDIDAAATTYSAIISHAVPDSEGLLQQSLQHCGRRGMAEDFAGCGNLVLAAAGEAWLATHPLARHGVMPDDRPSNPQWGSSAQT